MIFLQNYLPISKKEILLSSELHSIQFLLNGLKHLEKYIQLPVPSKKSEPSWFGFPILVKKDSPVSRLEIIEALNSQNIGTRLLFGGNLLKQPYFSDVSFRVVGDLENTDRIMNQVFWIGLHPSIDEPQLKFVVNQLSKIFNH